MIEEMASAEHKIAVVQRPSGLPSSHRIGAELPVSPRESQPSPYSGLVFLVMVALLSFSISVRVIQVNSVLHRSNQSTISNMSSKTKTDVPAPAPIQLDNALRLISYVSPQPRLPGASFDRMRRADTPLTKWLWYSVAVQHRPPPAFLS